MPEMSQALTRAVAAAAVADTPVEAFLAMEAASSPLAVTAAVADTSVEPVTLRLALERVATTLGVGEAARREARELAAAVLGVAPGELWLRRDDVLSPGVAVRLARAAALRRRGVPAAYAAGVRAFRTIDLACDARALIPRPETEGLVELVLHWAQRRWGDGPWGDAADIGAGTGCIALSLAAEGRFTRVIAVERSREAARLARHNVARVAPPVRVEVRLGDLVGPLAGEPVDVLVSNPPYLSDDDYRVVDPSVRDFEPRGALWGGSSGLEVTERLLAAGRGVMRPGGLIALEVDCRRARAVAARARALGWRRARVAFDLWGRARYVLAQWEGP